VPQGSHTGPTEHNHIRLVKRPAKGTHQRAGVFDRQLGQRVSDTYIVDIRAEDRYSLADKPNAFQITVGGETVVNLTSSAGKTLNNHFFKTNKRINLSSVW
jgi:hypothetical protein